MARVGLLEDNTRIANMCATMLQYAGHQATIYEYPKMFFQQVLPATNKVTSVSSSPCDFATPLPIDLLILDFYLPDMSGLEVIQKLQHNPQTRALPLILCTAANGAEVKRTLQLFPLVGFVEKPFHIQSLVNAISASLDEASKRKSSV